MANTKLQADGSRESWHESGLNFLHSAGLCQGASHTCRSSCVIAQMQRVGGRKGGEWRGAGVTGPDFIN